MALDTGNSLYWQTGIDLSGARKGARETRGIIANLAKQISALDVFAALSAGAVLHGKRVIKEITLLAARYETLGVVMRTVGNNAGYTFAEMEAFAKGLEKTGISLIESRHNLIRMTQANLDLTKSTQLARVAQDAAVIGNINSSEAFAKMVHGIQSAQVEVLRTIGINVSFENSYQKVAKATDRSTTSFTEAEKAQIRMNAVLEAGERIAGTYSASMDTAGKKMNSLKRHTENAKVMLGAAFTPALAEMVDLVTGSVTDLNKSLEENEEAVADWGVDFRLTVMKIEAEVMALAMTLDLIGGGMAMVMQGIAKAGAVLTPFDMFDEDVEKYQTLIEKFAGRYSETEDKRIALAEKYIEIEESKTQAAKDRAAAEKDAAEQARLAAVAAAGSEKAAAAEPTRKYRGFGDYDDAEFKRLKEEEEARAAYLKELDATYREWKISSSKQMVAAEIERIETEMAGYTEEQNYKMGLIDELETRKQQLHDFEVDENKAALDTIIKDTRGWSRDELKVYADFLLEQAALYADNAALQEEIFEKYSDVMEASYTAEIKKIQEVGKALSALGDLIGTFDENLASTVNKVAAMTDDVAGLAEGFATQNWLQVGTSAVSLTTKLIEYFDKSEERDRLDELSREALGKWIGNQRTFISDMDNSVKAYVQAIKTLSDLSATGKDPIFGKLSPEELAEVRRSLKGIKEEYDAMMTGTTSGSIADAITDGFKQGLRSAEDFADTFEALMANALIGSFKRQIVGQMVEDWYEQMAVLSEDADGLTSKDIGVLSTSFKDVIAGAESRWSDLQAIMGGAGLSLDTSAPGTQQGMAGAIKGITEKTAGVLEGQFNAIRMNTAEMLARVANIQEGKLIPMVNALREMRDMSYYTEGSPLYRQQRDIVNGISGGSSLADVVDQMDDMLIVTEKIEQNTRWIIPLYRLMASRLRGSAGVTTEQETLRAMGA